MVCASYIAWKEPISTPSGKECPFTILSVTMSGLLIVYACVSAGCGSNDHHGTARRDVAPPAGVGPVLYAGQRRDILSQHPRRRGG